MKKELLYCQWSTVYAIYFAHSYFHDFGLSGEICESLISWFSDVFITINWHILKWKCSRGLTRENKTRENYHVYSKLHKKWEAKTWLCFNKNVWMWKVYMQTMSWIWIAWQMCVKFIGFNWLNVIEYGCRTRTTPQWTTPTQTSSTWRTPNPHNDNCPLRHSLPGQFPTRKAPYQDNCPLGQLPTRTRK